MKKNERFAPETLHYFFVLVCPWQAAAVFEPTTVMSFI